MGIAKSNNTYPDHFLCVPRIYPDYAQPNKLAKMHTRHPQTLPYKYHQLQEATLIVLFARDGFQNWWLYQLVLRINCFWTNLPYFLFEPEAVQVICLTIIFIIMQSN